MDKAIPFFVLVIPREQMSQLHGLQAKQWSQDEIEKLKVGYAKLELIPRGKGRLLIRAPQLYHAIKAMEGQK